MPFWTRKITEKSLSHGSCFQKNKFPPPYPCFSHFFLFLCRSNEMDFPTISRRPLLSVILPPLSPFAVLVPLVMLLLFYRIPTGPPLLHLELWLLLSSESSSLSMTHQPAVYPHYRLTTLHLSFFSGLCLYMHAITQWEAGIIFSLALHYMPCIRPSIWYN